MSINNLNTQNNNKITSGATISGTTYNNHVFIDDNGNVTQIKKQVKKRYKYYIDPELPDRLITQSCYIGVSDAESGDCSYGIALGFGDTIILLAEW